MIPVEASGKDRSPRFELLPAVRAHLVMEAIEYLLRFPGRIVDDRSIRFLCRVEKSPALGAVITCIPVDNEIGGLFRDGGPAVSGMARNRPSLFVCAVSLKGTFDEGVEIPHPLSFPDTEVGL